jgi:hypothetical protein
LTRTEELFQWLSKANCHEITVEWTREEEWEVYLVDRVGGVERTSEGNNKILDLALEDLIVQISEARWCPPLPELTII